MKATELNTFQLINAASSMSFEIRGRLNRLSDLDERPDFHPEPNAFVHTCIVVGRLQTIPASDSVILAGLLHDICKPDVMKINPKTGFPRCPGHAEVAGQLILDSPNIQNFITEFGGDVDKVANLVKFHNQFHQLGNMRKFKQDARLNQWAELGILIELKLLGKADNMTVGADWLNENPKTV